MKMVFKLFSFGFLIFTVVGIIFLCVGFGFQKKNNDFMERAVEVTGEITNIEYPYSGSYHSESSGSSSPIVTVAFEYNGEQYDDMALNYYSSDMREGQSIDLLYDTDTNEVQSVDGIGFLSKLFMMMGSIFIPIGLVLTFAMHKVMKIVENKMKNFNKERGDFYEIK